MKTISYKKGNYTYTDVTETNTNQQRKANDYRPHFKNKIETVLNKLYARNYRYSFKSQILVTRLCWVQKVH